MPALAPRIETLAGGIHFAAEEGGDCFKFCEGLAAWCAERGAVLGLGTRVERLAAEDGQITGVHTERGEFVADAYVLALGADSPLLMRPLGVRLPIIPAKGYSITVPKAPFPEPPTIPVLDELRKFGMMPLPDRLRMSGLAELAGYDTTPSHAAPRRSSRASPASSRSSRRASRPRAIPSPSAACARSRRRARRSSAARASPTCSTTPARATSAGRSPTARPGSSRPRSPTATPASR